jgi:phosphate transport system substrate-binding protein
MQFYVVGRWVPAISCLGVVLLASCSSPSGSGTSVDSTIAVDGSSTVFPITSVVVEAFVSQNPDAPAIETGFSGTGGGFEKFCRGETVINDASRPISKAEMKACSDAEIRYYELPVAFDAITVVVNPDNTWAQDITLEELETMWSPASQRQISSWRDVRAAWPDRPLKLYGPGRDSGTYDYFTDVVLGEGVDSRSDFSASEDDAILVDEISRDPEALGYFGFAYYEDNQDRLKALGVDAGEGAMLPSADTVLNADYQPFARPLFIYVNAKAAQDNPALRDFVNFYLENAATFAEAVGYVPLPEESYEIALTQVYRNKVGTAFGGTLEPGLTIDEVLQKQKTF